MQIQIRLSSNVKELFICRNRGVGIRSHSSLVSMTYKLRGGREGSLLV